MAMRLIAPALAVCLGVGAVASIPGEAATAAITAEDAPVAVTVVLPLVVPTAPTGLIDAEALGQYTSPFGVLTRQLDAATNSQVAIGIDPMIVVSIRILGSSAPPTAVSWLERLAAVPNETFPLSYADSDLTIASQAGSTGVLAPRSLDFAIDPTLFSPREEPAPTDAPSPTPTPTETPIEDGTPPPLPTTEELLDWPYTHTGIAWPKEGTVVTADLAVLKSSGYETAILDSANVSPATAGAPAATVAGYDILVSDQPVSAAFRQAALSTTDGASEAAMLQLSDALGAVSRTGPARGSHILVSGGREVPSFSSRFEETVRGLNALPSVRLVPLSTALEGDPAELDVVDSPQPAEAVRSVSGMLEAEAADEQFANIAEDPVAITADRRLRLLSLLSRSWENDPAAWPAAVDGYLADSLALRQSVQVVESSALTLGARRAPLPVTVSNELGQRVTVYLVVTPDTPLLRVLENQVELVVEPGSQRKGQVPVEAISNGSARMTVTLVSATGVAIGQPSHFGINVQAGFEEPIIIALAVLVVVVFAVGIVRNILRRRKAPVE